MAIETLRPSAAGDECNIAHEEGASCPNHYQNVDEAVADDGTTTVFTYSEPQAYERDLYNCDDHSVGSGTINKITVYAECEAVVGAHAKICIKSGTGAGAPDTVDESAAKDLTTSWASYNNEWATNPKTSAAWTWDEIDKLQIGVSLDSYDGNNTECTQVYVVVDYTAGAETYTKTVAMDALLEATDTKTITLSTLIEAEDTKTINLDILLRKLGITKTVALDILLGIATTKTIDLDILLCALGITKTVALDTLLKYVGETKTVDLDALIAYRGIGYGKGLKFTGTSDDYVDCGSHASLDITDAITLEYWIKLVDKTGWQGVLRKNNYTPWSMRKSDTHRFMVDITTSAGRVYAGYLAGLQANNDTLYYVVGTYDKDAGANNLKLYVNGALQDQRTNTGTINTSVGALQFGRANGTTDPFNGVIYQARISNKARTQAEITANWNGGIGRPFSKDANTIALWWIDEGSGATIADEIDNNNEGTIYGATWVEGVIPTTTPQLDTILRATDTKIVALDALLHGFGITETIDLDVFIAALGITKTVALDAWLEATSAETIDLDVLLRALGVTKTVALDVLLRYMGETKTIDLDVYIKDTSAVAVALDIILKAYPSGALGYIIEIRDSSGNLLAIVENVSGISLTQQLNRPPMLDFRLPADDSKISHIDPDNEIWLRDYETGTLIEKFLIGRRRDIRS